MPIASATLAIVFAVYMPPQAPSPGQIARSIRSTSSRLILPAKQAPTASKASMIVTSLPSTWPGMIEPAYRKTLARSSRAAAIIMPGSDLSQPARSTEPSSRSAIITVSTESAMTSRETSEKCIPSWPIAMPSETEMVPNSSGEPPAACTPFLTAWASRCSERLHGVISFQLDATPIWGLRKSSSPMPTARSIPRAAAFSRPSVTSRERGLRSRPPPGSCAMGRAYGVRRGSPVAASGCGPAGDGHALRCLGRGLEPGQPLLEVLAAQLVHRHHLADQVHHQPLVLAGHPPGDVRAGAGRDDRELDLLGVAHRLDEGQLDLDAVGRGVSDLHPALTVLPVALPGVVRADSGGRSGVGAAERRVDVLPGRPLGPVVEVVDEPVDASRIGRDGGRPDDLEGGTHARDSVAPPGPAQGPRAVERLHAMAHGRGAGRQPLTARACVRRRRPGPP